MNYRLEFKHGFNNYERLQSAILKALHCFQEKRAHKSKDMQFFFENAQIEIFKVFKRFKSNMKFTRADCWINSTISNNDKNTILMIFLFCHYCWSLLWCNYWKSLKSTFHDPKKSFYLLQWKPFKNDEKCLSFQLESSPRSQNI